MTNLDYWQTFVGEDSPEAFMRTYGSMEPEVCLARFLEDRNHLYGVVNQGQWTDTFQAPEQFQRLTVEVYLRSYLEETREEWWPALEAKPPSIPRRYREKFDQDKYPPPPSTDADADQADDNDPGVAEAENDYESRDYEDRAGEDTVPDETAEQASNQESEEAADFDSAADVDSRIADESAQEADASPETAP